MGGGGGRGGGREEGEGDVKTHYEIAPGLTP